MLYPSRRAVDGFFALAAGLTALTGTAASAQDDPFALPETVTSQTAQAAASAETVLAELEVDGRIHRRLVQVQGTGATAAIDAVGARAAGLPVPEEATGKIALSSLNLYDWRYDSLRQRVIVKLFRKNDGANYRDFASRDHELAQRTTIAALRIDYDLNFSASRSGTQGSGLVSAALTKGSFAVVTSAQVATGGLGEPVRARRLDSFVQMRLPGSTTVATLGDFITAGPSSQRPVRAAGLQIASDFAQNPDLVTNPMPAFSGSVAVPTSIDILTADTRLQVGKIEPGEFTLRNIPSNPGRGSLSVLLKDSLGREVVQTVDFYQSNTLLRPGLESMAVNFGFVRRRYGTANDAYGPLVASAFYRRGLSPFLTLEASAESTPGVLNFGSRADFTLGNVGLASFELKTSRENTVGDGAMIIGSIESLGRGISGRAGFTLPTADYRDVASRLGDSPPRKQFFANLGFDLRRDIPLQLSYVRQEPLARPRVPGEGVRNEFFTANMFYSSRSRLNFSINGGLRVADRRSYFLNAGVTLRFGAKHSASISAGRTSGQTVANIGYQYSDYENSKLRAQANVAMIEGRTRLTAAAIQEGRLATINGGLILAENQIAGQVGATGSLIITGGTVYARGQSSNGYALVRAGRVKGIPVKLENRLIGTTDGRGQILVQNLRPMVPQHIDVDGTKLPSDAVVLTSKHILSVPSRGVGLLDIEAMYFRPVILEVVDTGGAPIAAGLPIVASPSGRETLSGYDGMVEFNVASGDRGFRVTTPGGKCMVDVPPGLALDGPVQRLTCKPVTTIAREDQKPKRRLAAGKVARRN